MPSGRGPWKVSNDGGGGALAGVVALVVVAGAGFEGVTYLIREINAYRVEWLIASVAFFAIMGGAGALMAWYYRRDRVRVEAQIAAWRKERRAIPAAARPAVAAPAKVTVTHHHYDERQVTVVSNDNRQLHVHQVPAAAEPAVVETAVVEAAPERPAIARRTVRGVVVKLGEDERIRR